jgi:transposase-like protein
MDIHKNARLTPQGRERLAKMVLSGQTPQAASEAAGVCPRTGRKWVDRFKQEGVAGLQDRSSQPYRLPGGVPTAHVAIYGARRLPHDGARRSDICLRATECDDRYL